MNKEILENLLSDFRGYAREFENGVTEERAAEIVVTLAHLASEAEADLDADE